MLSAQQLRINGRRDDLLPPTTLDVGRGGLVLAVGERQEQRTALALSLSGRMKPSTGTVTWDNRPRIKALRRASALVDSPGVNEPEQHLTVRDLVTEDLALIPRRYRGALLSKPWLKINGFEDISGLWIEQLPSARRLELLTRLALADPATDLLVVDSPDRHGADPSGWLPRLEALAHDAGRPLAVVATVAALPDNWQGSAVLIGNATEQRPEAEPEATEGHSTDAQQITDAQAAEADQQPPTETPSHSMQRTAL